MTRHCGSRVRNPAYVARLNDASPALRRRGTFLTCVQQNPPRPFLPPSNGATIAFYRGIWSGFSRLRMAKPQEHTDMPEIDLKDRGLAALLAWLDSRPRPLVSRPSGQGRIVFPLDYGAFRLWRVARWKQYAGLWPGGLLLLASKRLSVPQDVPNWRGAAGFARLDPVLSHGQQRKSVARRVHGAAADTRPRSDDRRDPNSISPPCIASIATCTAILSWPDSLLWLLVC